MHTHRARRPLPPLSSCLWPGLAAALLGCASGPTPASSSTGATAAAPAEEIRVAVIGTSDLHGHVEPEALTVTDQAGQPRAVARGGLPLFAGYLANLRRHMPTVLLDGGDLFQGTLVSNLGEGQVVIDLYNQLGYTAAAIGNHEFDYGPVGPRAVPRSGSDDDPTGALKARIAAARFPFLSANVLDEKSGQPVSWPNAYPSRLVEIPVGAGRPPLRLGIVGGTAEDTPRTTNPLNLRGLRIAEVVPAVKAQAQALRQQGAAAVILTVHEGGDCKAFADPRDLAPCEGHDSRILRMARALQGDVDAIVGGHSHAGVAHLVGQVPVIQSFMGARYFGRVDLAFRRTPGGGYAIDRGRAQIHPPQELCSVEVAGAPPFALGAAGRQDRCVKAQLEGKALQPTRYEGAEVTASPEAEALIRPYGERAAARRAEPLGVRLAGKLGRSYRAESDLGRLLADLIREGAEAATGKPVDVAFQNGGGIRSELPTGEQRYGDLYEVLPFDNRLALMRVPGAALVELIKRNLRGSGGVLVPSGLSGEATCAAGAAGAGSAGADAIQLRLLDRAGKPLDQKRLYTIAVSDFLAAGGDNFGAILPMLPPDAVTYYDDLPPLRDLVMEALRRRKDKTLQPAAGPPRLRVPGPRPLRCPGEAPSSEAPAPAAPPAP